MDAHLGFPTKKIIEEMAELADSHLVGDAQHLFGDGDSHWGFLLYQAVHLFVKAFLVMFSHPSGTNIMANRSHS